MTSLHLPLALARDVTLLGGSALSLRMALLVLEGAAALPPVDPVVQVHVHDEDDERDEAYETWSDDEVTDGDGEAAWAPPPVTMEAEQGGVLVRVPMVDLVRATGAAPTNVRRACGILQGMRARWVDADGRVVTVPIVEGAGSGGTKAARGEAALHVEVNGLLAARLGYGREVEVPLDVLRGLAKRSGLLLLLRGLAALHERTVTDAVRVSVDIADLPHYTGLEVGDGSPWTQVHDYLVVGASELQRRPCGVTVRVLANNRLMYDPRPPREPGVEFGSAMEIDVEPRRTRAAGLRDVTLVWDHPRVVRGRRTKAVEVADAPV